MAPNLAILDQHLTPAAVLTYTECDRTYSPSAEDFATCDTGCPDPGCGGWTLVAALADSITAGGAR